MTSCIFLLHSPANKPNMPNFTRILFPPSWQNNSHLHLSQYFSRHGSQTSNFIRNPWSQCTILPKTLKESSWFWARTMTTNSHVLCSSTLTTLDFSSPSFPKAHWKQPIEKAVKSPSHLSPLFFGLRSPAATASSSCCTSLPSSAATLCRLQLPRRSTTPVTYRHNTALLPISLSPLRSCIVPRPGNGSGMFTGSTRGLGEMTGRA